MGQTKTSTFQPGVADLVAFGPDPDLTLKNRPDACINSFKNCLNKCLNFTLKINGFTTLLKTEFCKKKPLGNDLLMKIPDPTRSGLQSATLLNR